MSAEKRKTLRNKRKSVNNSKRRQTVLRMTNEAASRLESRIFSHKGAAKGLLCALQGLIAMSMTATAACAFSNLTYLGLSGMLPIILTVNLRVIGLRTLDLADHNEQGGGLGVGFYNFVGAKNVCVHHVI